MHQRVLITGAGGTVGRALRDGLAGRYPTLRLSDREPIDDLGDGEESVVADAQDMAAVQRSMEGVDAVVHLGSLPVEYPWEDILPNNIAGTYNTYEAARLAGVGRILFASSNHAIGFYRRDLTLDHRTAPRPDTRYGLSKAFGEHLGSYYADKFGLRVLNIRIGSCNPPDKPLDVRHLSTWISHRDMAQLVRVGLDYPDLHYATVYGMSGNTRGWWDNTLAYTMGYAPEDNAEDFADEVAPEPDDPVANAFHGGVYTSDEWHGDLERTTAHDGT